jgi:hypothetical protein
MFTKLCMQFTGRKSKLFRSIRKLKNIVFISLHSTVHWHSTWQESSKTGAVCPRQSQMLQPHCVHHALVRYSGYFITLYQLLRLRKINLNKLRWLW